MHLSTSLEINPRRGGNCASRPPSYGRFLQADPLGYEGDGPNLYAYVLNDPVNRTDPFGLLEDKSKTTVPSCTGTRLCLSYPNGVAQAFSGVGPGGYGGVFGGYWSKTSVPTFTDASGAIVVTAPFYVWTSYVGSFFSDVDIQLTGIVATIKRTVSSAVCSMAPIGVGGGVDFYAGAGGTLAGGVSMNPKNGVVSAFFSTGAGVGAGGGAFSQVLVNAPSGISGSLTLDAAAAAGVGASASYTLVGKGAGEFAGAAGRTGPELTGNAHVSANGSLGFQVFRGCR